MSNMTWLQIGILTFGLLLLPHFGCERADNRRSKSSNEVEVSSERTTVPEGVSDNGEPTMKKLLQALLDDMSAIAEQHGEVFDTDVKEQMGQAIDHEFIAPLKDYVLPDEFGMFEAEGNAAVKAALAKFIAAAEATARKQGLLTRNERLAAFQDIDVRTTDGEYAYDDFFGHVDE